jgi:tetratricopeptide (TPR) repeat protein
MSSDPGKNPSLEPGRKTQLAPPETLVAHSTSPNTDVAAGSGPFAFASGSRPLPDYELIGVLGRGGCGEVWKATGPGGFEVALKFVRLGEQAGTVEQRSLELMKRIRHAHLLPMFGAWQRDGMLIIAMELADRTLWHRWQEAVNQGLPGIPSDELLVYVQEAAKGLDYLNEPHHRSESGELLGIQHKDIKPQNLLLVGGTVKVADFGLAKVLEHTVTHASGGLTPAYAAPEFFQGQTTRWSDQYCLGVSYCLLRGGRLPFEGTGVQVMAGHVLQPPDLTMLPERERPAVARALAKDPEKRWPNCRQFVEALASSSGKGADAATTQVPGRIPGTSPRPEAPSRRVRVTGLVAAIVLPALAALALALWWGRGMRSPVADEPAAEVRQEPVPEVRQEPVAEVRQKEPQTTIVERPKPVEEPPKPLPPVLPPPAAVLRLTPVSATTVDTGKTGFLDVAIQRQDCTGPVQVTIADLPDGVRAEALTLAADQDAGRVELRAADDMPATTKTVRVAAELGKLRVEHQSLLTVRVTPSVQLLPVDDMSLQRHMLRTISVRLQRRNFSGPVEVRLENLPESIKSHPVKVAANADRARLEVSAGPRAALVKHDVKIVAVATGIRAEGRLHISVVADRPLSDWIDECSQAIFKHPDEAGNYYDRGRFYYDEKEYVNSVADLTAAIRLSPGHAADYYHRANSFVKIKELDKAVADCDRAIELDPQMASAYNTRGVARADRGDFAMALPDYNEAIRLDPKYAVALSNRGNAFSRLNQPDKAMADYDKAVQLDPKYVLTYIGRGNLYRTQKQLDKALADYNAVVRLDPQSPIGFNNRGNVYLDWKQYDKAIADYTEAIHVDPKYSLAYLNRARAYDRKGDAERAKADREKAKQLNPLGNKKSD